ncbi:hypothetical protein FS935_19155 [Metabacillus litoralis]|uniref:DUF4352 domain-containing protein n=1 Tax=Metabacillus litoralis TaxID=152268 RepID=A0A5C6VL18_9BACI|nr:hypothetical protein [Metabacillus litoralis]TXC85947.1 hypothetical protein FS935_19155 [Metabacillus litoralis]
MPYVFFLLTFLALIALLIGLIKPSIVIRWGDREKKSRKKVLTWYGLSSLILFIGFIITIPELTPEQKAQRAEELMASAQAELENKNFDEAKDYLEDALSYVPELEGASSLMAEIEKLQADEKEKLKAEKKAKKQEEIQQLLKTANQLIEEKKYDDAKEKLEEALALDSNLKEATALLSQVEENKVLEKEQASAEKEAKSKEEAKKLTAKAEKLISEHKYDEAKKQLEKAQKVYAKDEDSQKLLSSIDELKSDYEKEIKEQAQASKKKKNKDKALALVKKAEEYIDEHNYAKALAKVEEALDLSPGLEEAKYWAQQIEVMEVAWENEQRNQEKAQQASKNTDYIQVDDPVYTELGLTFTNLKAKKESFLGYETTVITFQVTNQGEDPFEITNGAFMLKKNNGNSIWPVDGTISTDGGDFISVGIMPGDTVQVEEVYELPDETLAGYDLLLPLTNGESIYLYYFY